MRITLSRRMASSARTARSSKLPTSDVYAMICFPYRDKSGKVDWRYPGARARDPPCQTGECDGRQEGRFDTIKKTVDPEWGQDGSGQTLTFEIVENDRVPAWARASHAQHGELANETGQSLTKIFVPEAFRPRPQDTSGNFANNTLSAAATASRSNNPLNSTPCTGRPIHRHRRRRHRCNDRCLPRAN